MRRYTILSLFLLFSVQLITTSTFAHSGGTNADGCHTNRKTGDYHCHNAKPRSPYRNTYCHVVNGERRCGYAKSTCEDLRSELGGRCVAE